MADSFIATATEEERHKWTAENLADVLEEHGEDHITSRQLLRRLHPERRNSAERYSYEQLAGTAKVVIPSSPAEARTAYPSPNPIPTTMQPTSEQRYELVEDQYNGQTPPRNTTQGLPDASLRSAGKNIAEVARMLTDDMKYSSNGEDEALDHKMRIFYDVYDRVSLPQELLMKAFPALLKGIALDHFYSNALSRRSLEEAITNLKNFFEGLGFHRRNLDT